MMDGDRTGAALEGHLQHLGGLLKDLNENPPAAGDGNVYPSLLISMPEGYGGAESKAFPQGLQASAMALSYVIETLNRLPQTRGHIRLLEALRTALIDVSMGKSHPMLTPLKAGKRITPLEYQDVKVNAAIAMDLMMDSKLFDRVKASQAVEKELGGIRISDGAQRDFADADTVAGWRERFSEGPSGRSQDSDAAWKRYKAWRAGYAGAINQAIIERQLATLRAAADRYRISGFGMAKTE